MSKDIKVGDKVFIESVYGREKLYGDVIEIREHRENSIVISFENGWHVDSYPIEAVNK